MARKGMIYDMEIVGKRPHLEYKLECACGEKRLMSADFKKSGTLTAECETCQKKYKRRYKTRDSEIQFLEETILIN